MIHSVRFICVLDTNVIYPIEIRDLLFWFAHYDLYTPKWSEHIFDEWADVMKRKGVSEGEISKRITKANRAFPDAFVSNYSGLISGLELPDKNDRHVLAAAIKTNANVIVTNNIKDIPIIAKRIPNVPGTHSIEYKSEVDTIDLKHTAHSRDGFALGAVTAAEWLVNKTGVYTMRDVLGLK